MNNTRGTVELLVALEPAPETAEIDVRRIMSFSGGSAGCTAAIPVKLPNRDVVVDETGVDAAGASTSSNSMSPISRTHFSGPRSVRKTFNGSYCGLQRRCGRSILPMGLSSYGHSDGFRDLERPMRWHAKGTFLRRSWSRAAYPTGWDASG